jgi:hypothetical protein
MPGKQTQAQAPSAADERKRLAKQRQKSRRRNRVKTRNVSDFSAARALDIASRVSSSISVISAPVNLSKRIEQAGAAAAAQAQRDHAASLAMASVEAAGLRAAAAIGVARAIEQQGKNQQEEQAARLSGMAQEVRSTLQAGVGALNERQEAAIADFEQQAAAAAAAAAKGFEGTAKMSAGVRDELTAAASAAAASAAASTKGAAAAAIAASTKALAELDKITAKMDAAFAALKEAAASGQKALEAAAKIVTNCIQEMADAIPGCEGDEKIKMYFCPKHVVYAEKERAPADYTGSVCEFKQRINGVEVIEKIKQGLDHGVHYLFEGVVGLAKQRIPIPWPSLCCERDFTTFDAGWSKAGDSGDGTRYTYVEYPMRLANSMVTDNKAFSWGQIVFNEPRQETANREFIKGQCPELAAAFDAKDNDIAKIYFNSKGMWHAKAAAGASDDDEAALMAEEFRGGDEGCNDYNEPAAGSDATSIIELLANLIKVLVRKEIRKSRQPNYCGDQQRKMVIEGAK